MQRLNKNDLGLMLLAKTRIADLNPIHMWEETIKILDEIEVIIQNNNSTLSHKDQYVDKFSILATKKDLYYKIGQKEKGYEYLCQLIEMFNKSKDKNNAPRMI